MSRDAESFVSLTGNTTVANGEAFNAEGVERLSLQVSGIVSGDIVKAQASNDGGATWSDLADDITADGIYSIQVGAGMYRARRSDITGAGTVEAVFGGYR